MDPHANMCQPQSPSLTALFRFTCLGCGLETFKQSQFAGTNRQNAQGSAEVFESDLNKQTQFKASSFSCLAVDLGGAMRG